MEPSHILQTHFGLTTASTVGCHVDYYYPLIHEISSPGSCWYRKKQEMLGLIPDGCSVIPFLTPLPLPDSDFSLHTQLRPCLPASLPISCCLK